MIQEQLQKGNELAESIAITKRALDNLRLSHKKGKKAEKSYDENTYWLNISELTRHDGNKKLLNVITQELERQLKEFKDEFDRL